ncbi:hypothetical protein GCM10027589_09350 [Actinocorallia lasiicapitis]
MRRYATALLAALLATALCSPAALADPPPGVISAELQLTYPENYVVPGATQHVEGTLRYTNADSQSVEPAGETVVVTAQGQGSRAVQTYSAVTGEGGRFAVDVKIAERTSVVASWGAFKSPLSIIPVKTRLPVFRFTKFSFSASAMVEARAEWGYHQSTEGDTERPFELQYSRDGKAWKTIRRVSGEVFVDFGPRPFFHGASGYWRWRYPGDAMYLESVTASRKALRWRTEMSKVKVAQKSVKVGKKVTVSGTLYRYSATKKKRFAYKNQKIDIVFRCKGKKQWWRSATGKTNSRGQFRINAKTYCDSYFAAVFPGGKDTFNTGSPNDVYVNTLGSPLIRTRPFTLPPANRLHP